MQVSTRLAAGNPAGRHGPGPQRAHRIGKAYSEKKKIMAGEIRVTKEEVEDAMGDYDQGPTPVLLREDLLEEEAFFI